MKIRSLLIVIAVVCAAGTSAASAQGRSNRGGGLPSGILQLKLTCIEDVDPTMATGPAGEVLGRAMRESPSDLPIMSFGFLDTISKTPDEPANVVTRQLAFNFSRDVTLIEEQRNKAAQWVSEHLKAVIASAPDLTAEQRLAKLKEIEVKIASLWKQNGALSVLSEVKSDPPALLKEKLQQLRQEVQRLEIERNAKEARRQALTRAIDQQRVRAEAARQDDQIAKEMRKLVELRENEYQQRKASGGTTSDLEAALAEARIRLAEREANVGKAGKGELLDRLTDELAMISVDTTDLELRLRQVQDELSQYNLANIDAAKLDALVKDHPELSYNNTSGINATNLGQQVRAEIGDLEIQRFQLMVTDVSVSVVPPDVSNADEPGDPNNFRRGGRSGRRGE
jgi:hypothetical protein